ncbi:hypothetical protein PC121_g12526 [Phytophthora cactorum]|nr:hypothetical protein PC120_g23806 [Phytophthora cactorum]KAG3062593.1 hypothetical protein PC121_g12526 [Phytophthora cactorum]
MTRGRSDLKSVDQLLKLRKGGDEIIGSPDPWTINMTMITKKDPEKDSDFYLDGPLRR